MARSAARRPSPRHPPHRTIRSRPCDRSTPARFADRCHRLRHTTPRRGCGPGRPRRAHHRSWRPGCGDGSRRSGRHLRDRAALGSSGFVGEGEQADLGRFGDVLGRDSYRGRTFDIDRRDGDDLRPATATASRGGSGLGGGRQPRLGEVGGVSETRGIADDNPDAGASVAPAGQFLDPTIVEYRRRGALVLDEHFGEFTTGSHCGGRGSVDELVIEHGASEKSG